MRKIQFVLENGEVVEAKKDCDCLDHDIPHWLHMDELMHRMNLRILETSNGCDVFGFHLAWIGFAQEEYARLREKIANMEYRKIKKILWTDEMSEYENKVFQEFREKVEKEIEASFKRKDC